MRYRKVQMRFKGKFSSRRSYIHKKKLKLITNLSSSSDLPNEALTTAMVEFCGQEIFPV